MGRECPRENSPPLKIVLGSLAPSPKEQEPPETYILGTSYAYLSSPRIGTKFNKLSKDGRVPMEDRKGPFDHFRPKALVLSTVRVTAVNISTTLSTYFSDQLQSEQQVEALVDSGKLTPHEADELNEEWEEREWKLRTDALPRKIGLALLRFHAVTAFMRFYELVLGRYILKIDCVGENPISGSTSNVDSKNSHGLSHEQAVSVMDKLTRDPFQASLRTSQLLHNQEHSLGKVLSLDGIETTTHRELVSRMFSTCLWANVIPFLAELTVQQGILFYGYGVYYLEKRRKRKEREEMLRREKDVNGVVDNQHDTGGEIGVEDECIAESVYALSFVLKSSHLTIAKSMSWIAASAGGAMGSYVRPGWGTVFGIQFGDTIVNSLTG